MLKGNLIDFNFNIEKNICLFFLNIYQGFKFTIRGNPNKKYPLIAKTTWGVYHLGGRLVLGGRD